MYWTADDAEGQARLAAFAQALEQLGWSDGRNLRIDIRWADDIRRHPAELVAERSRGWYWQSFPKPIAPANSSEPVFSH
jgi:hypothetical protein